MTSRIGALIVAALLVAVCGNDTDTATTTAPQADAAPSFETITPDAAAAEIGDGADDVIVLDVRTPEEFAQGHLEDAVLIDFYRDDFADQLAQLDPDARYVVYCRSGNRSGQTLPVMQELGFASADDIGGGIVAWERAGYPVVGD